MNINSVSKSLIKYVTDPKTAGISAFIGIGTYKTISDCYKAPDSEKSTVLCRDGLMLLGSCLAFLVGKTVTKKLNSTQLVNSAAELLQSAKNFVKSTRFFQNHLASTFSKISKVLRGAENVAYNSLKTTEHVLKECISAIVNTSAAILGAVGANALSEKYVLNKPFFKVESTELTDSKDKNKDSDKKHKKGYFESSEVFNKFNYINPYAQKTAERVAYTISDIKELRMFESPMAALTGCSIAQTRGYRNKAKKASYELISNTFTPTLFVTLASMLVERAKPMVKIPVLLTSLVAGSISGEMLAKHYKNKIDKKIDDINFANLPSVPDLSLVNNLLDKNFFRG